jgi:hypothetical protein
MKGTFLMLRTYLHTQNVIEIIWTTELLKKALTRVLIKALISTSICFFLMFEPRILAYGGQIKN